MAETESTVPADPAIIADKIRGALAAKGGIPKKETGDEKVNKPAEDAPAPKAKAAEAKKPEPKPAEEEPAAEASADEGEGSETEDKPDDADKKEPKTARAKEWVEIRKVKGELAKMARDLKNKSAELTRDRAEFSKIQTGMSELNKLLEENPAEFVKRVSKGNVRDLIKRALEQPDETPEQREKREMREELAELKKWRAEREEIEKKSRAEQQQTAAQRQEQENRHRNIDTIDGVISDEHPNLKALPKQLRAIVAEAALDRIIKTVREEGYQPNISEVLSALEGELYPQPAASEQPSERASGAVETAKPEAKRAPALKSTTVQQRATSPRPQSLEDKVRALAPKLRRA